VVRAAKTAAHGKRRRVRELAEFSLQIAPRPFELRVESVDRKVHGMEFAIEYR